MLAFSFFQVMADYDVNTLVHVKQVSENLNDALYEATVLSVADDKIHVKYAHLKGEDDQPLEEDTLKSQFYKMDLDFDSVAIGKGDKVYVNIQSGWWPAEVTAVLSDNAVMLRTYGTHTNVVSLDKVRPSNESPKQVRPACLKPASPCLFMKGHSFAGD